MAETLIVSIRNTPQQKIDLVYDDSYRTGPKGTDEYQFILREWNKAPTPDVEIYMQPSEFIALLKAGLDYYEVDKMLLKKAGLQVVK